MNFIKILLTLPLLLLVWLLCLAGQHLQNIFADNAFSAFIAVGWVAESASGM